VYLRTYLCVCWTSWWHAVRFHQEVPVARSAGGFVSPGSPCTWQNVLMARSMARALGKHRDFSDPGKPRCSEVSLLTLLVAVSVRLQAQLSAPVQLGLLQLQQPILL